MDGCFFPIKNVANNVTPIMAAAATAPKGYMLLSETALVSVEAVEVGKGSVVSYGIAVGAGVGDGVGDGVGVGVGLGVGLRVGVGEGVGVGVEVGVGVRVGSANGACSWSAKTVKSMLFPCLPLSAYIVFRVL